ncbi:uncharacterized protein A1O9_06720 [Exophiala aquamarina CBS 119918]|uniref:feruloyl esterase n=1 Tax=Exophiala aquamarina CBS 119918 TaxID=1182545 RepID=A0A072P9T8_9EURO|nr:uncharacterized protein A1O9_06720 [Exophiala aquamarina CBS 119918]KEF56532.1 hypothetical protein A1O9_06720 [Exophiala aquamarina CBS 119918]
MISLLALLQLLAVSSALYIRSPGYGTPGCGTSHSSLLGANSTSWTIPSSGSERKFLVHVPSTYNAHKPTGVIFSYHGNSRNAQYQETLSQFSDPSFNPDHIAIYPQGLNNSWQGPSYAVAGVNDFQFTTDVIAHLSDNFCIDKSRIYASGKSNGGGFVGTLACSPEGGAFAAFAPVSGAFYTDNPDTYTQCSPTRNEIPILEFHGGNDSTIPYTGGKGKGGLLPDIDQWLGWWAERDGLSDKKVLSEYGGQVKHTVYGAGEYTGLVQGYKVENLGHDWPSAKPNLDSDTPTVVEATAVIMEFFKQWKLRP